ncbi:MAG: CDP-alcohol phosphatidyltransferase family protein [Candidatus Kerfeldbacteria bacterium]|nr:CDP-alcohol phosphatidyltransferase family protein [Candidatus Kerfeldbacteria bacterium]
MSNQRPIAAPYTAPHDVIKKEDGFLAYYFSAQVANRIVWFTFRFLPRVTPNFFTSSSLMLGLLTAYLFSRGDYQSLIWGVIILHISFIFDCCDGQLARLMGLKIQAGAWFDYHSDKIKDGCILIGFAWGAYTASGDQLVWVLLLAFFGIFFQFLRNICALNRDMFTLETSGKKDTPRMFIKNDKGNQLLRTLKHSSLFKLSDRVLLYTIFGLTNHAAFGIVLYAALAFFFSTISGLLNYKVFMEYDSNQNKK